MTPDSFEGALPVPQNLCSTQTWVGSQLFAPHVSATGDEGAAGAAAVDVGAVGATGNGALVSPQATTSEMATRNVILRCIATEYVIPSLRQLRSRLQ